MTEYKERRYKVEAKRDPDNSEWTDWAITDDYEEAVRHLDTIRSLGFSGRIIDKSGIAEIAKMIEAEYDKALKLDYVINPMAYALYAVWKKVDKEGKKKTEEDRYYQKECPFCHRSHRKVKGANIMCGCNAKYYYEDKVWLDRNTGRELWENERN